jgi:hypothetical protein
MRPMIAKLTLPLPVAIVASALPVQELTSISYKNLLYEVVVNVFASAEFKAMMGDYLFVRFTNHTA